MLTIIKERGSKRESVINLRYSCSIYYFIRTTSIGQFYKYNIRKITEEKLFYWAVKGSKIKNNSLSPQIDFVEKTKSYLCIE